MKTLALSLLLTSSIALAQSAPSVAGKWDVHSSVAGNESDTKCSFTQAENKLTGTCSTADQGDKQLSGSVDGEKVMWKYDTTYNDSPLTITYNGKIADGKMAGDMNVDPMGISGEFTAAPAKAAPAAK